MGWSKNKSRSSRSGSRSMSLSNSVDRKYSYDRSRSNSRSLDSRGYSRSASRSRSNSYSDRRSGKNFKVIGYKSKRSGGGRFQIANRLNKAKHASGKSIKSKPSKEKYNSPPYLLKIYSQIGKDFKLEELKNLDLISNYSCLLHVFKGNSIRDLVNLMKGERPEYRHTKGFWRFYRLSSGEAVTVSRIHSLRSHQDSDSKTLGDIGLEIGTPLFLSIDNDNNENN